MDKLRDHLRANGWKQTVRAVPMLVRRRLGGSDSPPTLPAPRPQTPQEPADPPSGRAISSGPLYPHLGAATDPELMKGILQRYLRPFDGTASRVLECEVRSVDERRRRCIVQYTLRLGEGGQEGGGRRRITGLMYADGRAQQRFEELSPYELNHPVPDPSTMAAPTFYVSELDMLAQVFPHDYRLPALSVLMAQRPPELAILLLARLGPGDWHVETWSAKLVRYRVAARATLRLSVRARDPATGRQEENHYYAKVYLDEQVAGQTSQVLGAEQTYRVLGQLWDRASMGDEAFTVGRPIAYLSGLRTVVQEEVSGISLDDVLRQEEEPTWAVRKVARALANLHLSDVIPPRRRRLRNEVALLEVARKDLLLARPQLEPEIKEIFGTVVAGLHEVPPAPTHGELKTEHLLLEGDRVALIDLDTFVGDDPLWDVARLSYVLARAASPDLLLRSDNAQALVHAFVEEYFAHVPGAWRERLPLHYAGTTFKKAADLVRRKAPSWPERVESLLVEAQQSLDGRVW